MSSDVTIALISVIGTVIVGLAGIWRTRASDLRKDNDSLRTRLRNLEDRSRKELEEKTKEILRLTDERSKARIVVNIGVTQIEKTSPLDPKATWKDVMDPEVTEAELIDRLYDITGMR